MREREMRSGKGGERKFKEEGERKKKVRLEEGEEKRKKR